MGNRVLITGVVVIVVVFSILGYIWSLKSDIEDRDVVIKELRQTLADAEVDVNLKKADITRLKSSIERQNLVIKSREIDVKKLQAEITDWSNRPPKTKYITREVEKIIKEASKPSEDVCKDILNFNEGLKVLNYEDI